jgi:hypothetical protein
MGDPVKNENATDPVHFAHETAQPAEPAYSAPELASSDKAPANRQFGDRTRLF